MDRKERFANWYHKHVYTKLLSFYSHLHSKSKYETLDFLNLIDKYGEEVIAFCVGGSAIGHYYFASNPAMNNASSISEHILAGAMILGGMFSIIYFNHGILRHQSSIVDRLNLKKEKIDPQKELPYIIKNLNELADSEKLSQDEFNTEVNKSLENVISKAYGYELNYPKEIKTSRYADFKLAHNCGGRLDTFLLEVCIYNTHNLSAISHEKGHLIGFSRERDATILGYVVLKESDNKYLQYCAYKMRLSSFIRDSALWLDENSSEKPEDQIGELLVKKGLNDKTDLERKEEMNVSTIAYNRLSKYMKIKCAFIGWYGSKLFSLDGQGNRHQAYISEPMEYIYAYDPPE